MGGIIIICAAVLGCVLSGLLAAKSMDRWNSRSRAIGSGMLVAPICVLAGAVLEAQFYSEYDLRTGGVFALGLIAIFGAGITCFIGGLIAAFVSEGMKQPNETIWSDEEGDTDGYPSDEDKARYG